jgi:L-Ala-D/L-Glu epimerase / N-acetyl-D-glutamate racemase
MKITLVEADALRMRMRRETSAWQWTQLVLVRVETDEGVVGFGEACPGYAYTGETAATVTAVIASHLAPALIGRDPLAIEAIARRWEETGVGNEAARGALEMALWDVKGKVFARPLYALLGGLSRSAVPEAYPLDREEAPEALAARAAALHRDGIAVFKLYLCPGDERELRDGRLDLVAALRDAVGPRAEIRVDANQGWGTVARAVAGIKRIERYGVAFVEEPLPAGHLGDCRRVRARTDVPLCLDESVRSPRDALAAVREEACDLINVKLMKTGGILGALKVNAIAEAAGVGVHVGNMGHGSVGTAPVIHLHAALANAVSSDTDPPWRGGDFARDLATGLEMQTIDGVSSMRIPEKPGLGVTPDESAVAEQLVSRTRITRAGRSP